MVLSWELKVDSEPDPSTIPPRQPRVPIHEPIVLFGLARSVYTRIARLVLEEKAVPYSLQEVDIFGAAGVPPEHLDRHPFGRIPVLQHGKLTTLYETTAITRYVDEFFPGTSLQPSDPLRRARMNQVIGIVDAYAYRPMVWGVFVQRVRVPQNGGTPNESEISASLQSATTCLRALSGLLGAAPVMAGDSLSLADLHAYPILCCFALSPEGRQLLVAHDALHRWFKAMSMRTSVARTASPCETV